MSQNINMRQVTEAKNILDRITTYDDITQFEQKNADIMYNEELDNDSSEDEVFMMVEKMDPKKYDQVKQVYHQYEETMKAQEFCLPIIQPPPQNIVKSSLEDIIDGIKREVPVDQQEYEFEERVNAAFAKTITLPAECLPPQLLLKSNKQTLPKPKRLIRSQLDPVFQASNQTDKSVEIDSQVEKLQKHQQKYRTPQIKEYLPNKHQQQLNQSGLNSFYQSKIQENTDYINNKLSLKSKIQQQTRLINSQTRNAKPKLLFHHENVGDLIKLEKNFNNINNSGSLIKGYDVIMKTVQQ